MVKDNKKAFGVKKILKNIWKESRKAIPLHRFSRKALMIGLWCNGSTTGFGSVRLGSNPGRTTRKIDVKMKRDWPLASLFLYAHSVL